MGLVTRAGMCPPHRRKTGGAGLHQRHVRERDRVPDRGKSKFNPPTLIYPNTKYCGERFAQSFADTYGMTVTCLRFANVYGPHIDCLRKQPPFVGYMIRELYYDRTPEFHSDGNQRRDYIYVDDLIALALRVVEQPAEGL